MKIDYPGIGGSLGECCVCGKSFCKEVLLGQSVATGKLDGFDLDLPLHKECADLLQNISATTKDWRELPEGPLRREFETATGGQEEPNEN